VTAVAANVPPTRRDATRETILAAGLRCFAREGFRRTALDRVAREAGLSRAALYLHFASKEDLFRAIVEDLHGRALDEATAACNGTGPFSQRLTDAIAAKSARFFDLLRASEHAQEFLDENNRLCGEMSSAFAARHARLITRMIASADDAGEISLRGAGVNAGQIAELLLDTAMGIKTRNLSVLSPAQYRKRLADAVRIVLGGIAAPAAKRASRQAASAGRAAPAKSRRR